MNSYKFDVFADEEFGIPTRYRGVIRANSEDDAKIKIIESMRSQSDFNDFSEVKVKLIDQDFTIVAIG